jgi:hypothetical protein
VLRARAVRMSLTMVEASTGVNHRGDEIEPKLNAPPSRNNSPPDEKRALRVLW